MADKAISELVAAQQITATDMFVLEQNGTAKKLTGQVLLNWLTAAADGHGGIKDLKPLKTEGLADTYRITLADTTTFDFVVTNGRGVNSIVKASTSGLVDTYQISYNDGTSGTFTVTNGAKGDKGDTAYIFIKYASQQPTASSSSFGDVPDDWMGVYFGFSSTAPTNWQEYAWYKIKGERGETGEAATLLSGVVTYQTSTSGTIIPSGSWQANIPVVSQGNYLWTRTVYTFNTGEPVTQYSVARFGIDGSGAVSSVAGISPDAAGNVALDASHVKALPIGGGTMLGPINMNGQAISGLNAPVADTEPVTKGYAEENFASKDVLDKAKSLPGFIQIFAGSVIPEGFLLCDGAAYSRTEYPELFAAIGTMYGEGDGSTTFNVPNIVERVPAGAGDNHPAGQMVGEETHKLTESELPSITKNVKYGSEDLTWGDDSGSPGWRLTGGYASTRGRVAMPISFGGDQPHNIMQPTTYIRGYIIATGKGSGVSVSDIVTGVQALPLEVKYGGTGATNAADARKNLGLGAVNLTDNSDFLHFVAQAGIGGAHGTQAYAGDRWILDSGTVTGDANPNGDGYSNIKLNGTIRQIIADPPDVGTVFVEMVSGTATAVYADGEVTVTSTGGVIKNVALFPGVYTAENKPAYQPKGYGAELAECQRYFVKLVNVRVIGLMYTPNGDTRVYVPFPVTMRIVPTVSISSLITTLSVGPSASTVNKTISIGRLAVSVNALIGFVSANHADYSHTGDVMAFVSEDQTITASADL